MAFIEAIGYEGGPCRAGFRRLTDDRTCIVGLNCQPATRLLRKGCVHEHVFDVWLCEKHAATDRVSHCAFCLKADGHICVLMGIPWGGM
jgi:hypothetical protein